jgi:hypothetical protein
LLLVGLAFLVRNLLLVELFLFVELFYSLPLKVL